MMRPIPSMPPPGVNGTTSLTKRVGQVCGEVARAAAPRPASDEASGCCRHLNKLAATEHECFSLRRSTGDREGSRGPGCRFQSRMLIPASPMTGSFHHHLGLDQLGSPAKSRPRPPRPSPPAGSQDRRWRRPCWRLSLFTICGGVFAGTNSPIHEDTSAGHAGLGGCRQIQPQSPLQCRHRQSADLAGSDQGQARGDETNITSTRPGIRSLNAGLRRRDRGHGSSRRRSCA